MLMQVQVRAGWCALSVSATTRPPQALAGISALFRSTCDHASLCFVSAESSCYINLRRHLLRRPTVLTLPLATPTQVHLAALRKLTEVLNSPPPTQKKLATPHTGLSCPPQAYRDLSSAQPPPHTRTYLFRCQPVLVGAEQLLELCILSQQLLQLSLAQLAGSLQGRQQRLHAQQEHRKQQEQQQGKGSGRQSRACRASRLAAA